MPGWAAPSLNPPAERKKDKFHVLGKLSHLWRKQWLRRTNSSSATLSGLTSRCARYLCSRSAVGHGESMNESLARQSLHSVDCLGCQCKSRCTIDHLDAASTKPQTTRRVSHLPSLSPSPLQSQWPLLWPS